MTELIRQIWQLLTTRWDFFAGLLAEHLQISLLAILIAVAVGGLAGVLISEYRRLARPTLGVVNFLYTIPSISMLGFLIPFSGVGNATAVIALSDPALKDNAMVSGEIPDGAYVAFLIPALFATVLFFFFNKKMRRYLEKG